jgi:hypothetical protein
VRDCNDGDSTYTKSKGGIRDDAANVNKESTGTASNECDVARAMVLYTLI